MRSFFGVIALILAVCILTAKRVEPYRQPQKVEPRTRVAVIDTGLDLKDPRFADVLCEGGHRDFTGQGIRDEIGHGTHIAGIIKQYADKANYCLVILKYYSDTAPGTVNAKNEIDAIRWALSLNVAVVNLSVYGPEFVIEEFELMASAKTTTFIVAAGNQNQDLATANAYPAGYKLSNMIVVGALDTTGQNKQTSSNYGAKVNVWEIGENVYSALPPRRSCGCNGIQFPKFSGCCGHMTGTSQATAVHTGKFIKGKFHASR